MNPIFSVVIPTYNRALLIKKAIDSVLQQTFLDWELLIIDDGSTDNTKEIIKSYKDNRLRYIYQQNSERCVARNKGIKNAKGKFICFLDSDDYYLHDRLELLFETLKKQNFPVAAFYTGAGIEKDNAISFKETLLYSENIFEHIVLSAIHSQQTCIHSTILREFNYDKRFHIGEDTELWLRIATKFPFIYLENQQTIIVVDQEGRSVNLKRHNVYLEFSHTLQHIFSQKNISNKISNSIKRSLISNCYFGSAKYFIYNNNKWQSIKNLILSIGTDFSHFQTRYRVKIMLTLLSTNGIEKAKRII